MNKGFSLVELSIVLVILGLLVGGVLGGQSLIHAAQLRSVTEDFNKYQTAVNAFRDRYRAIPGDMPNATRFWGAQAGATTDGVDATCAALDYDEPATGKATCNGNGDGKIVGTNWHEVWRSWQHLANAGLVEGQFTGVNGHATYTLYGVAGENVPASRMDGAGYALSHIAPYPVYSTGMFAGRYGNLIRFAAGQGMDESPGMIKAEDAWNIDSKIDDGSPATGNVLTYSNATRPNCVSNDDAATAVYLVQNATKGCNLFFLMGF